MRQCLQSQKLQGFCNLETMKENGWPNISRKFVTGDNLVKEKSRKTLSEVIRSDH